LEAESIRIEAPIPGKHTVARWNYKKFNSALSDFLSKDTTLKDKTNHLYDKLV